MAAKKAAKGKGKSRKKRRNPGVPAILMNPGKETGMAAKRKRRSSGTRRSSRRSSRRRSGGFRRRSNPAGGGIAMAIGMGFLAGAVLVGVRYGVQQVNIGNTARGAVLAGVGVAAGIGAAYMGHPGVGTALAAAGTAAGGAMVLDDNTAAASTPAKKLAFGNRKQLRGFEDDLTDDEAEALGALTATLGDADDDDEEDMGAIEADLGAIEADLGDADDDDDDESMGDAEGDELLYS